MKFGTQLRQSLITNFEYHYIDYDRLKYELKSRLYPSGSPTPKKWTEQDEKAFVQLLEEELDKVFTFQKTKAVEIVRRIKVSEREVEEVVKQLDSRPPARASSSSQPGGEGPTEEDFDLLEADLSDIIADVHDLAKFTQLNYTGFQKIIKKHDKQTGWTLKPIFAARLNAKPFFRDNYDAFIVKLSKLYDLVRTRGHPAQGDSGAGGSQSSFVRQTTKYWIHPDNITELKLVILKHLPVLVFNPNKEFEKEDSAISSIYFDNKDFELYLGRLRKDEGAEALRLRWYGGMGANTIYVERKTHREDWTGEKSVKARFPLKEKNVNAFLRGEYTVEQAFEKMRKEGKKSKKEIEENEALAKECQYSVIKRRLRPAVRSFYNRVAFQLPGDARVRISLDTELCMIREDNWDGRIRSGNNWRRMDIGVDWPFNQLPEKDIVRFPYAILEVKLQTQTGQEPPSWVRELVSSHLVEAVPKFSKFIHGTATLFPDKINLLPFWLPQMHVDIRKPVTHRFGIERPNQLSSASTSDEMLDSDEESDIEDNNKNTSTAINGRNQLRITNGGGGNIMDQEERVAAEVPEDQPLYDSEDDDDVDGNSSRRPRRGPVHEAIFNGFKTAFIRAKSAIHRTTRASTDTGTLNPLMNGTLTYRTFKAPPGKRIFVPVRVEPKVFFAAERTFLSWFEFSIYLGAISALLLNFGADSEHRRKAVIALYSAWGFTVAAVGSLIYSMVVYWWRIDKIKKRRAVRYHDKWGPTILCVMLLVSVGLNAWFNIVGKHL
ncbi:VTC domain-containing protein [Kalaharituber pfeilii]|nr:VTC domain-containing protein [Kalaharituber pfeilii]